ncbi:MAG: alpha/beta fold hydrolase [Gammaproteobacteria bacterium]|nr:MAG: alpha/beta fold hydrolase [Gammaproteobacteria bacterium]
MLNNKYYTQDQHGPYEFYALGDFQLESGEILNNAQLAFAVHGKLNEAKDNAILFTIMFSGTSKNMEHYIGAGKALDPEKYCIILPNQLGGGLSTSPHNIDGSQAMTGFPNISIADDVAAQRKLLTEYFGIQELQLVTGWSMGAQQTYEWAIRYPDMVKRAAPIAGTAKCTSHDALYVDVFSDALKSDPAWNGGNYTEVHSCKLGLKRLANVFALMGCCTEFYNKEQWVKLGFGSMQKMLEGFWHAWFQPMDANALLTQAKKWKSGDSSKHAGGDLVQALKRIKAKTYVIAFEQDMFVPVKDCKYEQKYIANSELIVIPSLMGHFAMLGLLEEDFAAINDTFMSLLSS